jgi:hypothetical protein
VNLEILHMEEVGSTDFQWWSAEAGTEHFARTWDCVIVIDGHERDARHGLGVRHVYGRERAHSVTFVGGQPAAEGVGSGHWKRSRRDTSNSSLLITELRSTLRTAETESRSRSVMRTSNPG